MAEQLQLVLDGPVGDGLVGLHAVLEQRAPKLEILRSKIAIGDGDADQRLLRYCLARADRCAEGLVEPEQRARAHAQDQLVHVGHEIVDRAISAADIAGEIAGF